MTQVGQIYKCAICGNAVEVKAAGVGELVCCGQPMGLAPEKQEAPAAETVPEEKPKTEITEVTPEAPTPQEEPEPTQ
jgi:superoxide reductase